MERDNEHERIDLETDTTNRQDYEIEHGAKKYRACEFDCRGKHYAMVESRGQVIMIIGWEHGGETGECVECLQPSHCPGQICRLAHPPEVQEMDARLFAGHVLVDGDDVDAPLEIGRAHV